MTNLDWSIIIVLLSQNNNNNNDNNNSIITTVLSFIFFGVRIFLSVVYIYVLKELWIDPRFQIEERIEYLLIKFIIQE